MKKTYTIAMLFLLLIGCSTDEAGNEEVQNPTIENISTNNAGIGDIIIINGINFQPNANYVIEFNGAGGEIIEITSRLIRVQIPENATSGNITLTYNDQTTIIGEIMITSSTESSFKLYAIKDFMGFSNPKLTEFIQIDPESGNETKILELGNNQSVESLTFDEPNNRVIGVSSRTDENDNITNQLIIIDVVTNTFTSTNLGDDVYYELSLSPGGKLFAIKDFPGYSNPMQTKFIEINLDNGNETELLELSSNQYIESLVFDEQNNRVIGVSYSEDENDIVLNKLFIINLTTNTFNTINLSEDVYYELSLSPDGKLFAIKDFPGYTNPKPTQFIEINLSNGSETALMELDTNRFIESLVFDEHNNRILGVSYFEDENGNTGNSLFIINISDNPSQKLGLKGDAFYQLAY